MLITHALNGQKGLKSQTPKRKITQIATSKNHLHFQAKHSGSNKKLSCNKQNENPNIKKSPTQQKDGMAMNNPKSKQLRVKSQYYNSSNISVTKQSPIKKILFVKNMCYKSNKTSKNSSLERKQENIPTIKYLSLNHCADKNELYAEGKMNLDSQNMHLDSQRNDKFEKIYSAKNLQENQSEIFQEQRPSQKTLHEFKPKQKLCYQSQSHANYRLSVTPNQFHPRLHPSSNQNYSSKTSLQRLSNFQYPSSLVNQNFNAKYNNRMCPNIQSTDLSAVQTFKNKNYLLPSKNQAKPLISMDRQKKQSLSSKKRNSRVKITSRQSQRHMLSFHEDLLTEQSQRFNVVNTRQSHQSKKRSITDHMTSKINTQMSHELKNQEKFNYQKKYTEDSTLLQTKSHNEDDTFLSLSSQFSKINLNESKQIKSSERMLANNQRHCCRIHPEKEAKFKVNKNDLNPFYCSKCTVLLVTQGYKVTQNLEEKSSRLHQLKNFIFKIEVLEPKIKKSQEDILFLENQLMHAQKKGTDQINTYYRKMVQNLEIHRQNALEVLKLDSKKVYSQLQMCKKRILENAEEIIFIKGDILPNVDLIVNESRLPDESFKHIIFQHENKLEILSQSIDKVYSILDGKQHRIVFKTAQVSTSEVLDSLKILEDTQIVFRDKSLNLGRKNHRSGLYVNDSQNPLTQMDNSGLDQTKRSFSFDDQNLDVSFYVPSSKKKSRNQYLPTLQNFQQLGDSIRMSFGNKFQANNSTSMPSPSFKAI